MRIPQFDLTRQYARIEPEVEAAVRRVLRSGRFILGPEGEALEAESAAVLGVEHAVGVSSGSEALRLARSCCPGHRPWERAGIRTACHYPLPIPDQPLFRALGYDATVFPAAWAAAREVLSLPCFPELTDQEVDAVVTAIRAFF